MKRGFQGAPRPLLPSMLLVATNPPAGQEHAAVAQSQPSSSTPQVQSPLSIPTPTPPPITIPTPPPIPTPTPPPITTPTPPHIPTPTPPPLPTPTPPPIPSPTPPPDTDPTTLEHIYEEQSPVLTDQKKKELMLKRKSQDDLYDFSTRMVTPSSTKVNDFRRNNEDIIQILLKQPETLPRCLFKAEEEASLAEAIRLDTLQKEEVAKQVHLDSLLAQRIAEEEELNEQQKKRKAQVI
ncbi:hypothetical protein Tco_0574288 [Tanacetum coccineum]